MSTGTPRSFMTEIVDFAASERSLDRQAFQSFAGSLCERVEAANHQLEAEVLEPDDTASIEHAVEITYEGLYELAED